jgi:ribosomal protein S18 acetylase RimI-like enzyme
MTPIKPEWSSLLRFEDTEEIEGRYTTVSSLWLYTVRLPSRWLAVIEEVGTVPEYRRQGRATKLVKDAIAHARNLGCDCVELTVREDRPDLKAFYESLGFKDRFNRAMRLAL